MTSQAVRDPLADHLITPQNSAFLLIDWQPTQISTVRSMNQELLLRNAISTVRAVKAYGVPVVHSTVNVASGQQQPTVPELVSGLERNRSAGCPLPASCSAIGLVWKQFRHSSRSS
jgi:nicotinamidase-related amidase